MLLRRASILLLVLVTVFALEERGHHTANADHGQPWTAYFTDFQTIRPLSTSDYSVGPYTFLMEALEFSIDPEAETAYVLSYQSGLINKVDLVSQTVVSSLHQVADTTSIAYAPDGETVYFTHGNGLTAIDTATDAVSPAIPAGYQPRGVAISPDGKTAYVTGESTLLHRIDLTTGTPLEPLSIAPFDGRSIVIAPSGRFAYIGSQASVLIVDLVTGGVSALESNIQNAYAIAITPDGGTLYVVSYSNGLVFPVDLHAQTIGSPIPTPLHPFTIAIAPDGHTAFVGSSGYIYVLDLSTNTVLHRTANLNAHWVAITPDQAPEARFTSVPAVAGRETSFDASSSTTRFGDIVLYEWDFGDGHRVTTSSPTVAHTFAQAGSFAVSLSVTNSGGTSTETVFNGQITLRNGGPEAVAETVVTVVNPTVTPTVVPSFTATSVPEVSGGGRAPTAISSPTATPEPEPTAIRAVEGVAQTPPPRGIVLPDTGSGLVGVRSSAESGSVAGRIPAIVLLIGLAITSSSLMGLKAPRATR